MKYEYKVINISIVSFLSEEEKSNLNDGWEIIGISDKTAVLRKLKSETRNYHVIYGFRDNDVWKEINRFIDIEVNRDDRADDIFLKISDALGNPSNHHSEFVIKQINRL